MNKSQKNNNAYPFIPVIFMMLALLWLTVSLPFVYVSEQGLIKKGLKASCECPVSDNDEDTTNSFGNSTEEKASGTSSYSEAYLHDHHMSIRFFSSNPKFYRFEDEDAYHAFHGELLVPPPNAI